MYPQKDFSPTRVDLEVEKFDNTVIRAAIRALRQDRKAFVDVYGEEHTEFKLHPFKDGTYHCYYHPCQEFDVLADATIMSVFQYATPSSLIKGEVPTVYGCTFYRQWEPVEIDDDDFVVVTGSSIGEPDEKFTAVFKGVRNVAY